MASKRELRVERRRKSIHTARRHEGWRHESVDGVWLECDGKGRCGDFEQWMVEWLTARDEHALPECRRELWADGGLNVGATIRNANKAVIAAISRVLQEANDGD